MEKTVILDLMSQILIFKLLAHVVELAPEKREDKSKIFGSIDNTPKYTITQGVKSVLQSKEVFAIAKGKGKAKAVGDLFNGVFTKNSPITALINHSGKVTVFTDEEAAHLLIKVSLWNNGQGKIIQKRLKLQKKIY